jgi:hypothetical protein
MLKALKRSARFDVMRSDAVGKGRWIRDPPFCSHMKGINAGRCPSPNRSAGFVAEHGQ